MQVEKEAKKPKKPRNRGTRKPRKKERSKEGRREREKRQEDLFLAYLRGCKAEDPSSSVVPARAAPSRKPQATSHKLYPRLPSMHD
jgi:hypothetical protein